MTVAVHTLRKLRRLYQEIWNREWPHDNEFLSELWKETRNGITARTGPRVQRAFDECVILMRENHEFTPGENA